MTHTTRRLAWLTDIHLEMLTDAEFDAFMDDIRATHPTDVMITGDIGTGISLCGYLTRIESALNIPIYFVLGNHDFYRSNFDTVHAEVRELHSTHDNLVWMPEAGVVELNAATALVGHGGWSDGGYGDFMASPTLLNDHVQIMSLVTSDKRERLEKVALRGRQSADMLKPHLMSAVRDYPHTYVLTHSPPFIEACWYMGKTPALTDEYLPHFTCKAIGDLLLDVADTHPQHKITVLCGHTHGGGEAQIRPNLHVITGPAEYGLPVVQQVFAL